MAGKSRQHVAEAKLKDVEARARRLPGSIELKYERARLLDELGRTDAAKKAYIEVATKDPKHFRALSDLAMLLYKTGQRQEAFLIYNEAAARHPDNAVAHANLAYMLVKAGELQSAREHYETALRLDAGNTEAQRGLAVVLTQLGEGTAIEAMAAAGGSQGSTVVLPYRGDGRPIMLLVLVTLGTGNVAIDRLFDDRVFQTIKIAIELFDLQTPLPPHDVIFNAVGDADSAPAALDRAAALAAKSTAPLFNAPASVRATARAINAERLRALDGIVTARIEELPRDLFLAPQTAQKLAESGIRAPMLLRSPGYHTGQNFVLVERNEDLSPASELLPGRTLLAMEFVDTRDAAGQYRKYRAMCVDGRLYPLHMAISPNWKVHYFSADMADRPDYRALDAAFLEDMPGALGSAAMEALERVVATLGLEYAGIDFALNRDGNVVVFEANATMVLSPPGDDERWAYRRAPVERIFAAVRNMLASAARGTHPAGATRRSS